MLNNTFHLKSDVIVYPTMGGWRFLAVDPETSREIREVFGGRAKGWGSIPVVVTVGATPWKKSIFPEKKSGTYLLPLNAQIRKAEEIADADEVRFSIKI